MKHLLLLLLVISHSVQAQTDKKMLRRLKKSVEYLSNDKLEGRRTGSKGEKLAYEYISKKFRENGLVTIGEYKDYIQPFPVYDGREIANASFSVNGTQFTLREDYEPLAFSGDAIQVRISNLKEASLYNIDALIRENKDNPHFELKESIGTLAKDVQKSGKKVLLLVNEDSANDNIISFEKNDKIERLTIPVIYLRRSFLDKWDEGKKGFEGELNFNIKEHSRTGHNVIGYLDNLSLQTVVLGAHYDHLGYGEDHNSLYAGSVPMIHNGADDNASGTAALIELAGLLKKSPVKKYNYLFVAFSGEELGLFGSKYFTDHSPVDLKQVDYMINMDMVGRLNDSTHGISIGGYGTSPTWGEIIREKDDYFRIKLDSSGSGPSDHTSFYRKDIPVLFFFTGTHSDYHKPSDDADKINYKGELQVIRYIMALIEKTADKGKLAFTKTRESSSTGKSSFKVTLGIMPDYTYSGSGVLVDGVSEGRPAQKAGIKTGDVIIQLGDHPVSDVQTYMQALGKFKKGDPARVKVKRNGEAIEFNIIF
jgi:hypothetical protein